MRAKYREEKKHLDKKRPFQKKRAWISADTILNSIKL